LAGQALHERDFTGALAAYGLSFVQTDFAVFTV
jgi:hypothetical protein